MSTAEALRPATEGPVRRTRGGAERAIARRAFRQVRVGALLVGLTTGLSVYATATAYSKTYPTAALRQQAADLVGSDAGLRILLGPIGEIATIGGYTVYKNFAFLTTVGAVWAVLAGTRVLRGEEDAGRWQLQLAGATRPGRGTAAALGGLAAGLLVVLLLGTGLSLLTARDPALGMPAGSTLLYGLTLAAVPAVFAAVGAVTSQLARTRRTATGLGLAVVGAAFVLRMAGDAGDRTAWLGWLTPFGWAELVHPYTHRDARPLVLALLVAGALAATAVTLAGRRDVGDGLLASRDTAAVRPFGLRTAFGLSLRLELPTLVAWVVGALLTGLLMGSFAVITTQDVPDSMLDMLRRYGLEGSFLEEFLGIAFLLLGTVVALLPASQTSSAVDEETSGRLVHLVAAPVDRRTWLAGRILVTMAAVLAAAVLGGAGVWAGAAVQGLRLDLALMLGAGLNVVPTALVALGVGSLVLSLAPRAAGATVYAVVVWSVFADLLAPLSGALEQVGTLSLFHWMALVPGEAADPATVTATVALGLALCAAGVVLFTRRDLRRD
ncbi:hypothetical protein [Kineosporia sp. A_224]|uniref:hypothetical protein n=1 Tax=Kineosporia sp. A_224 TaxID=1962180 RepID=UPI000B4B4578|nr:hypothetical protein [Kineosporia sp. A_224]